MTEFDEELFELKFSKLEKDIDNWLEWHEKEFEMGNKFKVGDRVAFYERCERRVGIVNRVYNDDVCVSGTHGDGVYSYTVHYKQCRKLVRKKAEIFYVDRKDLYRELAPVYYRDYVKVKIIK